MRVLQLIASNGFYGAERVVALLSSRLATLGCEVTVGLFNAAKMPDHGLLCAAEKNRLAVLDLPCGWRLDPRAVARLARFLCRAKIDVVHTHGYKANLYGLSAARLVGCTAIATCHNWTDSTPALRRYGSLDKFVLRGFDRVVAVSETVAATLRQAGFPSANLNVISNGVDTAAYHDPNRQYQAGTPLVLGALSRLSQEKGIDVLLRALPRILEQHPDLQCVVAGDGPERTRLLALAAELGVAAHLELPGFCANSQQFLTDCSVFVHSSRMEGMPMAILEAMAAAKPIIASAVGGIPAQLDGGLAGLLVPSEDPAALAEAILHMLADPELRQHYASHAAAFAREHFDAAIMAGHYLQAYRELCPARSFEPAPAELA